MADTTFVPGTVIASSWLNDVNAYIYSGTTVSVLQYMTPAQKADVMAGTLTMNTAPAFVTALATGKPVYIPKGPGWKYRIDTTISIPTNTVIFSDGAFITLANSVNAPLFAISGTTNSVQIRGVLFDGNKANNSTAAHMIALSSTGTNFVFTGNTFQNLPAAGVSISSTASNFLVNSNFLSQAPVGLGAIDITGASLFGIVSGNRISACAGYGIRVSNTGTLDVVLSENAFYNNTVNDVLATGKSITISNNTSYQCGGNSMAVSNFAAGAVTGNTIRQPNGHGIVGSLISDVAFTGNAISVSATGCGITLTTVSGECPVASNTCALCAQSGILISSSTRVQVATNVCASNNIGVQIDGATNCTVIGNHCNSNTTVGLSATNTQTCVIQGNECTFNTTHGIDISDCSYNAVGSNICKSNSGNGIYAASTTNITHCSFVGNICTLNTLYGFGGAVSGTGTTSTVATSAFIGNIFQNNTGGQAQTMDYTSPFIGNIINGEPETIPSAAALLIPVDNNVFNVSGTTGITSIPEVRYAGRQITLIFAGVLTVTDGGNLVLASNYTTTANDTLTLISDGTNWNEVSRSTN